MSTIERHAPTREYRMRWWTLGVIAFSVLVVLFGASIVNVALPTLQRELGATGSELQWILNAYILGFGALMLTTGAIADRLGRARVLSAGLLVFGAASVGACFAASATQLIFWRLGMGIGGSMILPATLAIVTNVFPREERGRAIGIWAGMNGIGVAIGPILGGFLVENFHWSSIFVVNVPVAFVAIIAGRFLVPDSRDPDPKHLDPLGALLSVASLLMLVFGLIKVSDWGWTDPAVLGWIAGGLAVGAAFVLWERHTREPMLEIGFFRNPRFSAGVAAVSMTAIAQMGISFGLTLYMQFVQGYSALDTGVRFIPLAAGILFGAGSADYLVARVGTSRVMASGFVVLTAMDILAAFWQVDTNYLQMGLVFFGFGFALGYIAAPAAEAIMGSLPESRAGIGSSMNGVCRMEAGSIGVAVLGSILNSVYSSSFSTAIRSIAGVPEAAIEAARNSVGAAVTLADRLPSPMGNAVAQLASESFMDGWQVMTIVSAIVAVTGVAFVLKFMPAHHLPVSARETTHGRAEQDTSSAA